MREPRWVARLMVDAVHCDQQSGHGGLSGIRDERVLEAVMAWPRVGDGEVGTGAQ